MTTVAQLKSKLKKLVEQDEENQQQKIGFVSRVDGLYEVNLSGECRRFETKKKARKATTNDVTLISVVKHQPKGKQLKLLEKYNV